MAQPRSRLASSFLLATIAALTAWVAMWSWGALVVDAKGFLNPLLALAAVVVGIGTAARWWRWPRSLVLLAQVVGSGMVASLLLCDSLLPVGAAWTELRASFSAALDSAHAYAAPVPPGPPPVDPLLIVGGLACLLLVDLLACTLHRVALAGMPLLAIFTIPASVAADAVAWWVFGLAVAGYLVMLFVRESEQVSRWGRPIRAAGAGAEPIAFGSGRHTARGTAGVVGGAATALAIIVPVVLPATGLHVFDFGPGQGSGDDIHVENPTADLVRDLKRGADVPLLRLTTTDPDPSYLRILTLTRFSDAEWSPGDRDVPADHLAQGQLPPPEGVASQVNRREYPYDVSVLQAFDSKWLPTQPPISRIDAEGDWRYDDRTMDFLAGDDDLTTAGLHYTMTATDLDITADRLDSATSPAGKVDDIFTELPADLPPMVADLAAQVTQGATTEYEQAVALQQWFRESGGFTYSLDRVEGSGSDALTQFLSTGPGGRTGYCEQFAAAMAAMARTLDIPARVAVGFLNPDPDGPRNWVYSSHDMHAWPELYFEGSGWVRFEPTPAGRAAETPAYTTSGTGQPVEPTEAASASESTSLAPRPERTQQRPVDRAAAPDTGQTSDGFPWGTTIAVLAVLVLGGAVVLLPRVIRARRRERRLGSGDPELIWAELRDTAVDLGVPWPTERSPRTTRDVLVDHLGHPVDATTAERPAHGPDVSPAAVAALDRLVHTLERHRYSRAGARLDDVRLRSDGEACAASLAGGATRAARRRAAWWPRSVVRLSRRGRPQAGTVEARHGGVVDRVG